MAITEQVQQLQAQEAALETQLQIEQTRTTTAKQKGAR